MHALKPTLQRKRQDTSETDNLNLFLFLTILCPKQKVNIDSKEHPWHAVNTKVHSNDFG